MWFSQFSHSRGAFLVNIGLLIAVSVAPTAFTSDRIRGGEVAVEFAHEPISPIPLKVPGDGRIAELGRRLFEDPRLSADNTVSCSRCHPLDRAGVDGLKFSVGFGGAVGTVNTPTVFNSSLNFAQFWNGRADSLEDQIDGPINDPSEMASNWEQVIEKLRSDDGYLKAFSQLYPQGMTSQSIKNAIATFERSLLTPNARFDQFLRGNNNAINDGELQGYLLFKKYGCSSCHQGVAVGGNMYEKLGVHRDYFAERGGVTEADFGRFNVTGIEDHRFEFKVPSLRNVALTAPYFHDGSRKTLEDAVSAMAKYQLGRSIDQVDVKSIVAFLKTLTGEMGQ